MIEKILSALQERMDYLVEQFRGCCDMEDLKWVSKIQEVEHSKKIVQEVAKEYAEIARESREDFMEIVYSELEEDADNNRANRIIDAFDTYAPYQKEVAKDGGWISCGERLPQEHLWGGRKKSAEVFVTYLDGDGEARTDTDNTYDGKWHYYGDRVIAWMPKMCPPPYQRGEQYERS